MSDYAVLISIRPEWCELIANGKKTIEVRKTRPKIETPFKCYIYETKGVYMPQVIDSGFRCQGAGEVIGEFVCDEIQGFEHRIQTPEDARSWQDCYEGYASDLYFMDGTMLSGKEIDDYGAGKFIYTWHISELVIYDKPKKLQEFYGYCNGYCGSYCKWYSQCSISEYSCALNCRPPQSWCYVEVSK